MNEDAKNELKDLGKEELEVLTKEAISAVVKAIEIIVKDTDNKLDDMIIPALPLIETKLLELADKIHTEE